MKGRRITSSAELTPGAAVVLILDVREARVERIEGGVIHARLPDGELHQVDPARVPTYLDIADPMTAAWEASRAPRLTPPRPPTPPQAAPPIFAPPADAPPTPAPFPDPPPATTGAPVRRITSEPRIVDLSELQPPRPAPEGPAEVINGSHIYIPNPERWRR